ncbi:Bro-N domain-containing protein [Comamonas aquatica]|uniref:BRO-N domain-containing protein n=1 Tax=Comamonas aquatica TaxID=225991 RepID=UPI00244D0D5B|nr:Bro-N domain-containing protein [Comamonas aquatica]MDH0901406.1 Bro-N domain-containing protein [Comamonas aquatica]
MADITPFNFGAHAVRVITRDNQPWFVASDVCQALGYSNTSKAIGDHLDEDERYNESLERGGSLLLINESGLYALVLRSRKPEARKFAKWVTSEVLPSIRQTGSYGQPAYDPDQVALAHRAALVATAQVYQSVFEAVMQAKDWQLNRYMLRFDVTAEEGTVARVKAVDRNAYVLPLDRFHSAVEDSICVDAQTLTQLASTCTARLGRMAARNAVAAPQQGNLQLR